jgi:hypothetical protein
MIDSSVSKINDKNLLSENMSTKITIRTFQTYIFLSTWKDGVKMRIQAKRPFG